MRKCQFKGKGKCHSRVLQHVCKIEIFDLVLSGVDLVVRILEVALDDKCRWVAGFRSRGVITAYNTVSTLFPWGKNGSPYKRSHILLEQRESGSTTQCQSLNNLLFVVSIPE